MGKLLLLIIHIVSYFNISPTNGKPIHLTVICDNGLHEMCQQTVKNHQSHHSRNFYTIENKLCNDDFETNLHVLNVSDDAWNIFLVFGDDATSNAAATVASFNKIPTFLYDTSNWKNTVFSSDVISLHGNPWSVGQATATIVENNFLKKTCFLVDYHYLNDQFLEGFISKSDGYTFNATQFILYKDEDDLSTLSLKLSQIKEHGFRIIVAHIPSFKIKRVFDICRQQNYFEPGYAWILSQLSMPGSDIEEDFYPSGLLGLQSKEIDGLESLLVKSINSIQSSLEQLDFQTLQDASSFRDAIIRLTTKDNKSNHELYFDEQKRRQNISYVVRNKEFKNNATKWKDIGYIGNEVFTLNTIYWPGYTIFGPIEDASPIYRVVTRHAEPFVFIHGPVEGPANCFSSIPCCLVNQTEPTAKSAFIDNCFANSTDAIYCCSGISIEMLDVLSNDLKFDYILYFENDEDYGTLVNGTMTGMVGDVISGVADIIAGAFSITSTRSRFITYTEPFYFSGYSLVMKKEISVPAMDAFLKPFDENVWLLVILSALGTGIATALLEWNSPFGLNPWARKRAKNYTLGSGLTMVFSLWFGHTVSTKPPKGWPSKVLQNVWAAMAIFIVASYTANLAAYLAGVVGETKSITGIMDNGLVSKSTSLIKSSSAADFIDKIDTKMRAASFVDSLEDGLQILRNGNVDIYIDDTPILEYKLAEVDSKCTIEFAGNEFGENFYAFGLSQKSIWLEDMLSTHILDYVESGYLTTITKKFVTSRDCKEKMSTDSVEPYDLEQIGGLFLMLVCGVALSVLLLVLEHAAFKFLVPYLRKQAADSRWKSRRTLEFFNQRLYRTVMSETLVSPQQTAREMMRIMKDRQFAKMFQKNELKEQQKAVQRSHPKGLKFMNLTDILLRSQSEDKSVCNGDTAIYSTSSSSKLYNISEEDEIGKVRFKIESQDVDEVFYSSDSSEGAPVVDHQEPSVCKQNNDTSLPHNCSDTHLDHHLRVNHLWDQKLQHDNAESSNSQAEMENLKKKRLQLSHSDTSCLTKRNGNVTLPKVKFCRTNKDSQEQFKETSRKPSTSQVAASNPSKPSKSKCYYSSSVKLKDNRVKSTIRRHALAQFKRHSTSVFDECAVEALSKEDLLVLWKRSEIELQTKLNKLQSQNNHLKCLLSIVESDDSDRASVHRNSSKKKPKFLCTKL